MNKIKDMFYNLSEEEEVYFFYWIITHPFKKILNYLSTYSNVRKLLNLFLVGIVISLFWIDISVFLHNLNPQWSNPYFWILVILSILIYIWKYSDPELGEVWKADLARLKKRRGR